MIQWLYRYVFKGIGTLMIIGMITLLLLAVMSQMRRAPQGAPTPPAGVSR